MSRTFLSLLLAAGAIQPLNAQAALQAGETVTVTTTAELKARPMADSSTLGAAPAGASASLVARVSNASGDWWYVEVSGNKGWLQESALTAAPAEAQPEPAAAPAPTPAVAPAIAPPPTPAPASAAVSTADPAPSAATRKPQLTAAGSKELELDFEYSESTVEGFTAEFTGLFLRLGHCVTDHHELGLQASYVKISEESYYGYGSGTITDTITVTSVGPFYTLNLPFPPSNVVPFLSLSAALTNAKSGGAFSGDSLRGYTAEAIAGARVFAADDVSVNIGLYYQASDQSDEYGGYSSKSYGLRAGLSGFLR